MTRVCLYARVSTSDQKCENQIPPLLEYAKMRGWIIAEDHIYIDQGESGAKDSRPALDRLMQAVRKRKVDLVLVWKFDRMGRNARHLIMTLEEMKNLGVGFVSYTEGIDTSTPMGKAMYTIISAFAELELSNIRERVRLGLARARAQGKRLGRKPLNVDVNQIKELRSRGLTIRQIAKEMKVGNGTVVRSLAMAEHGGM